MTKRFFTDDGHLNCSSIFFSALCSGKLSVLHRDDDVTSSEKISKIRRSRSLKKSPGNKLSKIFCFEMEWGLNSLLSFSLSPSLTFRLCTCLCTCLMYFPLIYPSHLTNAKSLVVYQLHSSMLSFCKFMRHTEAYSDVKTIMYT